MASSNYITQIEFEFGAIGWLKQCERVGIHRALVVTDRSVKAAARNASSTAWPGRWLWPVARKWSLPCERATERMGLPAGVAQLGVTRAMFPDMDRGAQKDHSHKTNPRVASDTDDIAMLDASL